MNNVEASHGNFHAPQQTRYQYDNLPPNSLTMAGQYHHHRPRTVYDRQIMSSSSPPPQDQYRPGTSATYGHMPVDFYQQQQYGFHGYPNIYTHHPQRMMNVNMGNVYPYSVSQPHIVQNGGGYAVDLLNQPLSIHLASPLTQVGSTHSSLGGNRMNGILTNQLLQEQHDNGMLLDRSGLGSFNSSNTKDVRGKRTKTKGGQRYHRNLRGKDTKEDMNGNYDRINVVATNVLDIGMAHSNDLSHVDSCYRKSGNRRTKKNGSNNVHNVMDNNSTDAVMYNLDSIPGNVCAMAKDPIGCRYLQAVLIDGSASGDLTTLMYQEAKKEMKALISDPYGNYFSQILFEFVSEEFKLAILEDLSSYILEASQSMFATRFIQRAIELSASNEKLMRSIIQSLQPHVLDICLNGNGRHVIQTCLRQFSVGLCDPIIAIVVEHCKFLSLNRHGCCVVQLCLEIERSTSNTVMLRKVLDYCIDLMQDPYGNYVVQLVLDSYEDDVIQDVCKAVVGNITQLSTQKFSSNVVEKCIIKASDELKEKYLEEILTSSPDEEELILLKLLKDKFGNYIVQRALSCMSKEKAFSMCENHIIPYLHSIDQSTNGKTSVEASVCKRLKSRIHQEFPSLMQSTDSLSTLASDHETSIDDNDRAVDDE